LGDNIARYTDKSGDRLIKNRFFVDLSENIHLHYRDLRLEFSIREWRQLAGLVNEVVHYLDKNPYKEGTNFFKDFIRPLPTDPDYFPNRIQAELLRNGQYHVHYNNFRFELLRENMVKLQKSMTEILKVKVVKVGEVKVRVLHENGSWSPEPLNLSPNYQALEKGDFSIHEKYMRLIKKYNPELPTTSTEDYKKLVESIRSKGVLWNDPPILVYDDKPLCEIRDGHHRICVAQFLFKFTHYMVSENKLIGAY